MQDNQLNVVLYWHMHQPDYRISANETYSQPWTYLHSIKDYVDMALHIEAIPEARAVFNFTPILLDQIQDYATQLSNYASKQTPVRDPLLAALIDPVKSANGNRRVELLDWCLRAHEERVIQRYPAYQQLVSIKNQLNNLEYAHIYLSNQYITDLVVWYHLGWLSEIVKRTDIRVKKLIKKSHSFDANDRMVLLNIISELLNSIIPRYNQLEKSGQIEITTTPYSHPIIPLLLDFDSADEAVPDIIKPIHKEYPGGNERAIWHIQKGIETFKQHFDFNPQGCWPSEGGLSEQTCALFKQHGFKWTASGNNVFVNSYKLSADDGYEYHMHRANKLSNQEIICFFRDDELSDAIGFEYSTWHADDAVANLISRLLDIAQHNQNNPEAIVSIILDGENAWEHYPENGYYFLNALYEKLSSHPKINLTTYSKYLETNAHIQELKGLVAGSWVYGSFTTWIGCDEKNYAWDLLCDAKLIFDKKIASGDLSNDEIDQATLQLAKCEGSDWFWWFGDYNPSISVISFEQLFRENLIYLYQLLNEEPPSHLYQSFTQGSSSTTIDGTMRRGSETH